MNKIIYLIPIACSISLGAADKIDPTKYRGGVAGYFLFHASQNALKLAEIAPQAATQAGENLVTGALSQLPPEKRKEIGAHLAQGFIAEMGTEKGCEAVFHLGESFVQGAAAGAVGVASTASKAVAAKATATVAAAKTSTVAAVSAAKASTIAAASTAKAATIAGATAAAPYVAVAAVVGVVGYGSYKTHRHFAEPVEQYHRCLNDNLGCDDLNDRGFPKVCDSLGSGAWNYLGTKGTCESSYKELKARLQAAKEKESC